jgi:murein biosynthesis integral membrane protein MurJ
MSWTQQLQRPNNLQNIQVRKTHRQILRALVSLMSAAFLLRAGGMVNQLVVSARFGTGAAMDAYFVAVAFPLLFIQLIRSAIEAGVVPIYSQLCLHASRDVTSRLFSTLLNGLVLCLIPLTVLLLFLRFSLIRVSAPGLDVARLAQAVALAPLLYLVVPLSLIVGLLECILNAEGQFGWPAYAALLVPLSTALLTVLGGRTVGVQILCIGTLLGTFFQFLTICFCVRQTHLRYQLVLDVRHPALATILRTFWPVLIGALVSQGSPLVDQIFASMLPEGSISALNYALKLVSLFSGIIFVSVGRAVLPFLSRQVALPDPGYRAFKAMLRLSVWCLSLTILGFSVLVFLLARPVVQLLFQHGAFTTEDTQHTVVVLLGFVPGLTPMAMSFLLTRVFNALGKMYIPMYVALVSVTANAFLDLFFAHFWQAWGIALATSLVYTLATVILLVALHQYLGKMSLWQPPDELLDFFIRRIKKMWRRCARFNRSGSLFFWKNLQRCVVFLSITCLVLCSGIVLTLRSGLDALRASVGLLVVLCFLRYPYILLLTVASVNVFIGSSIALFNGNNLDIMLIVPLLLIQGFLPWKRIAHELPGLIWFLLYLGWILVGMKLSPLSAGAFLILWLTMLAYVAVSALTIVLVTTHRRLYGLIDTLLATGLLAALSGLSGFVTRSGGEIDPETLMFRTTAWFTQATTYAFYLSLLIPLALLRCLRLRGKSKSIGVILLVCLLVALALTFTRSAYLSVLASVLIITCCSSERRIRMQVVGGLVVCCGLTLYLNWSGDLPLLARFFQSDVQTLNGRIYLWQALLSRFQVTQWLGNGLQASDVLLAQLRVGNLGQGVIGTAPHNLFLGTLYDHGVIGLALLAGMLLSLGSSLIQRVRRSNGERRLLSAAALAALVSVFLQSLTSRDIWIQAIGMPFWITVALPFAFVWGEGQKEVRTGKSSLQQK